MMKWKIYNQDVIEWAKSYSKGKFHALFTDAPYELNFMNNKWDNTKIAFRPETWAAMGEHLYPGAFGMAFSASRNWHRMAVAIEDAGFILHPTIFFLWVQGQGFPKATKVRADGFDGYKYGLQALKPSVEPIIMFQKPYEGRPIDNIVQTGAGVLNIDGTRIPTEDSLQGSRKGFLDGKGFGNIGHGKKTIAPRIINRFSNGAKPWGNAKGEEYETVLTVDGRYPANLILDEESAGRLDEQTGILKSGKMLPEHSRHTDGSPNGIYGKFDIDHPLQETIGDSGGASRFFYTVHDQIDEADPFYYCAKVNPKERNAGLDDEPDQLYAQSGGAVSALSRGETEYIQEDTFGMNRVKVVKNPHPTLKPIGLTTYLAKLLLPPEQYAPRRILIPFSGVGSEMIGAGLAGWEHVVGIEFKEEYVNIGKKRLEYWLNEHN